MHQDPIPVDLTDLETYFSAKPVPKDIEKDKPKEPESPSKDPKASARKTPTISLLDTKRANNMAIMISQFKLPVAVIKQAIVDLDDSLVSSEALAKMITVFPNEEEAPVLADYKGDLAAVGKAEAFFIQLLTVTRCRMKVGCFLYKLNYDVECDSLRGAINTITQACEEVITSKRFLRLLETILAVGNFLNQGTAKGNALGFKMDTLIKLMETRSVNQQAGIVTLLHYVVFIVQQNMPSLMLFNEDMPHLEPACKVSVSALLEQYKELKEGLLNVRKEAKACANDSDSEVFRDKIKAFLAEADLKFALLELDIKEMTDTLQKFAHFFGEEQETMAEELMQLLVKFVQGFQTCTKDLEREKEKNAKVSRLAKPADSTKESSIKSSKANLTAKKVSISEPVAAH